MNRQLDDPGFDPANDEWVGAGARWDQQSSIHSSGSSSGIRATPRRQKAPEIGEDDFEGVFRMLDAGGFAMTYDRCLARLHKEGQSHLSLDHVALVAELTGVRSSPRQWTAVPAPIRKLGRALGRERSRHRRKKK